MLALLPYYSDLVQIIKFLIFCEGLQIALERYWQLSVHTNIECGSYGANSYVHSIICLDIHVTLSGILDFVNFWKCRRPCFAIANFHCELPLLAPIVPKP